MSGSLMNFRRSLERYGSANDRRGGAGRARDDSEVPVCELDDVADGAVAGDDQDRVRGGVEPLVEVGGVVERRLLEMGEVAVAVVGVRVGVEGERRQRDPRKASVGPVENVDLDLLLYDRDLVAKVLVRERQRTHAVGLEPERELEPSRRERLVVGREVRAGVPVEDPAGALNQPEVLDLPDVGGALEHQVFEEVSEACPPLRLGSEADVVDDRDRDERAGAVRRDEHPESVAERGALELGEGHAPMSSPR